jgi:hypothetical protein
MKNDMPSFAYLVLIRELTYVIAKSEVRGSMSHVSLSRTCLGVYDKKNRLLADRRPKYLLIIICTTLVVFASRARRNGAGISFDQGPGLVLGIASL